MTNKNILIHLIVLLIILLIIFLFIIYLMTNKNYYEKFSNDKKTIYHVCKKHDNGLGDKIRSVMYLYSISKKINVNMLVNWKYSLMSKFFKNVNQGDNDYREEDIIDINQIYDESIVLKIIKENLLKKDTIYISTNIHTEEFENINDVRTYVKHILEPTDDIKKEIDLKIKKLPVNYGMIHVRFKDEDAVSINENNEEFINFFEIFKNKYKDTDVLISNSTNFKKYAKNKINNISIVECQENIYCDIGHTGQDDDIEKVKNSIIEFLIVSKSKNIKTISHYNSVSNFVKWTSIIYDIPIENLKK